MKKLQQYEVRSIMGRTGGKVPCLGCFDHYELIGDALYRVRKDGSVEGYPVVVLGETARQLFGVH